MSIKCIQLNLLFIVSNDPRRGSILRSKLGSGHMVLVSNITQTDRCIRVSNKLFVAGSDFSWIAFHVHAFFTVELVHVIYTENFYSWFSRCSCIHPRSQISSLQCPEKCYLWFWQPTDGMRWDMLVFGLVVGLTGKKSVHLMIKAWNFAC